MSDSEGVYFARLPELPLVPPHRFRDYVPLADDPDPADISFDIDTARGLCFGMEYCDSRGWVSMRTVRCLAASAEIPGYLSAWCQVRRTTRVFRLDRIISVTNLRTGRIMDGCSHQLLFDAILGRTPRDGVDTDPIVGVERDGAALLLSLAGPQADASERAVVGDYIAAERVARGIAVPSAQAVSLWVDHFVPEASFVGEAEDRLWADRDAMLRLLPWTLKIAAARGPVDPEADGAIRSLMDVARRRYASPRKRPAPAIVALR